MDVYTTGAQRFEHLEELTRQGEERKELRRDPNAMPDSYSLLNTLRAVGEFLDRKPEAKLLFASNRGQDVVILYETRAVFAIWKSTRFRRSTI